MNDSLGVSSYEQQILTILLAVGERGISVGSLTKHVYNQQRTFFFQPDLEEVKKEVRNFLLRNSKSPSSLIEHTGRRGYYRLNTRKSTAARSMVQSLFDAESEEVKAEDNTPRQDLSLSLFADE